MAGTTASELQGAIKSMAIGMFKGNTADTLGAPVDLVNTAIKPVTERLGIATDTPFGGSAHFRTLFGMDAADKNLAETAGSTLSIGGAAKAMIIGAARLGKAVDIDKATELTTKHPEVNPASVYNMTGVYKGEDGGLRAVISDKDAKLSSLPSELRVPFKLGDVLDHPELFSAYPELKNVDVIRDMTKKSGNASYTPARGAGDNPTIKLSSQDAAEVNAYLNYPSATGAKVLEKVKGTLLHETQHAVQDIEKWIPGGSPSQFLPANIDSQAKAVQDAVKRGRTSADPSVRDAAERYKDKFNAKIKDAHIKYENLPGEQEARYTQQTTDYSQVDLANNVRKMLKTGDNPQTWDTQIPKGIPAGTVAPPAPAISQESGILDKIKSLLGD